jgi:AcrR family transcriptional regulator
LLQPRTTQKAQQTRQQILDAALKLFQKKGFEATTMRDVAKEAGLAVGAAYYYFKSKEELVLGFYYDTLCSYDDACREVIPQTKDFEKRMKAVMARRFEQLAPFRHFLGVLARTGADPHSPISPFAPETRPLRDRAIQLFAEMIEGTQIKAPAALRPHLPTLIWVYHLGLLFFWVHDRSPDQRNTMVMMDKSLAAVTRFLKVLNLPMMGSAVKPLLDLIDGLWARSE